MRKLKLHNFEILKQKRRELGLTQKVMGNRFGITQQHWDRYEKGYPIPLEKVLRISNALNISRWELLPPEFRPEQPSALNEKKLTLIITSIERLIIEKKLQFSPEQKARLISLLYEKFNQESLNDNFESDITAFINDELKKFA